MTQYLPHCDRRIPVDKEGYLKNLADWNEQVAEALAASCDVQLGESHWEVLWAVRRFYQQHELSPPMRPLVRLVQNELGAEKGRSIYLMKLFGGSTAKTVNKIAGLPRPSNCI